MTMTTTDGPDRGRRRSVIAPTAPLAEDLVTTDPQGTDPGPRPRLRLPARVRIMLWVASLTAGVLLLVVLVTWQSLLGGLDGRVDAALGQEIEEFEEYARMGIDPETGQSFTHTEALMRAYLTHQQPDDSEILFGHVDEAPGAQVPTGRVRQGPEPVYDASADNGLLRAILDDDAARGSVRTPEGEMHWEKLRVKAPDGSGHPDGWFVVGYFTAADLAELGATTRTVGLVGAVGLLFTGTAAWWVSGRILAPVRLVRQAAAEISEEDLTRRIDVPGNDDVAALAEQFNGMLDRLQDAFDVQRRFIDDAGHELRTPITIVRGHLELMGDDPEERREVVRLVTDELDRMARIVEDLLLLAKAERPDFLHYERVSVEELTIDIDAKVRALGEREWRLEEIGEGPIRADPQRVTQAMVQLAANAVRHTPPGALVSIGSRVSTDGEQASFWVRDTGPGIPPEEQDRIFGRFARGASAGGDRAGAGLGLAIVRAIVDAHHGSVRLRSAPGEGASFTLTFPTGARSDRP
ncbi:sensor histidine kinase [Nocardiopsis composta]|nr:HAMP domain-containing sensor histidine kinase [Nocardiopsis composta]